MEQEFAASEYIDLTDDEIARATDAADDVYEKLMDEIEETGEDEIVIVHALFCDLVRILAMAGWSAEELTKDLVFHMTDQTTEGRA